MKVYFGTNYSGCFHGHPKYARAMKEIKCNMEFVWGDISGFIPAVYTSGKGIAIDFCVRVPNEKVRAFEEKWRPKLETHMEEEDTDALMRENPLNENFSVEIFINGQKLESVMGCGTCYSDVLPVKLPKDSMEAQLKEEFGCDDESSWCFKRHICRWKKQPKDLEHLEIKFISDRKEYFCEPIEIGLQDVGRSCELKHPVTGEKYELTVYDVKQQEIPFAVLENLQRAGQRKEYPSNLMVAEYSLEPSLSRQEFSLRDKRRGDKPRSIKTTVDNSDARIGIIGGADGPTAVFVAGKMGSGESTKAELVAMSNTYFEPVEKISWQPVFREKEREDMVLEIKFDVSEV